ncbi:hypothetical protein C4577_01370 [Candidatus Parcubacteria bacterium]|nr:MAG: hypothetical protein C4577_01370 [Candidatus Parcubacteria bacterium]
MQESCNIKNSAFNTGLTIVTVTEPCLMCISACSWAGLKEIYYMIPVKKYIDKIPWVSEAPNLDKDIVLSSLINPIKLTHLKEYENDFSKLFEEEMKELLR